MPEFRIETSLLVEKLTQEAQEVGAAMRRIVDAARYGETPSREDVTKADEWLRAVGA